jgi:hypothetical protein
MSALMYYKAFLAQKTIPVPESGCLFWLGAPNARGYCYIEYKGKSFRVHRLAWELAFGTIPDNLHVLHKCDITVCVNPNHLFLGTHTDNMQDKTNKGRAAKEKLTVADIVAIRKDYRPQETIAKEYDIKQWTVSRIKARKSWAHI